MREIGGYIEMDSYHLPMLHENAIALNSGRNCLRYLIRVKNIKKIVIPKFLCSSVADICYQERVSIRYYSIEKDFIPQKLELQNNEWMYIVNYYGQLGNDLLKQLVQTYERVIIDQVQAYFQIPIDGVDTIYTCRKFFGVPDGAFLYTTDILNDELPYDESYQRFQFLMGRYERNASNFYNDFKANERIIDELPLRKMSKLTFNMLHGIEYQSIKECRTQNFNILHKFFRNVNRLKLTVPEGAFMYPLYVKNGAQIRSLALKDNIYIPTLWPDVTEICDDKELEYDMANNILPLPVDQRYDMFDMQQIINVLCKYIY